MECIRQTKQKQKHFFRIWAFHMFTFGFFSSFFLISEIWQRCINQNMNTWTHIMCLFWFPFDLFMCVCVCSMYTTPNICVFVLHDKRPYKKNETELWNASIYGSPLYALLCIRQFNLFVQFCVSTNRAQLGILFSLFQSFHEATNKRRFAV